MKLFTKVPLLYCLLCVVVACSQGGNKKAAGTIVLPRAGVIHEAIEGFTGKEISYALYIPVINLTSSAAGTVRKSGSGPSCSHMPVMVLFDPHGSGVLPVRKYKELADRYGFILIGSNNSKNGLSTAAIRDILGPVFREIITIYPIDTNRIYMAGFSGGSRVASTAALMTHLVKGVIGCGAGLPGDTDPAGFRADFFGIVGTADFNMNEMLQLEEPMTRAGIRHFITTFPGPHAWPPVDIMEEGFQWITLNAMRDGRIPADKDLIGKIMDGFGKRVEDAVKENQLIAAAVLCREATAFAGGLASSDHFVSRLAEIEQFAAYKQQLSYRTALLKTEAAEQQVLGKSVSTMDLAWWKNRISLMDSRHMKGKNPEDTLMNARLKAFLSLVCYSYANGAIIQQRYREAEKFVALYETADPPNPEANYMQAILLANSGDAAAAMSQLKTAISKGFTEKQRLLQQPELQPLKSSPSWNEMLNAMK
ncbi:MAG: hypothetical protein WCO44_13540 [Bacteroidota bacterium]